MTWTPFLAELQRTAMAGTRPGLRPSMGSGQPAHPWAGLLLDRTRPSPWPQSSAKEGKEMGWTVGWQLMSVGHL